MKTALKLPGIILLTAILTGCAAQKQVGRTDQAIALQALYGQALQALEEQHFTIEVGEFQFPDGKPPVYATDSRISMQDRGRYRENDKGEKHEKRGCTIRHKG